MSLIWTLQMCMLLVYSGVTLVAPDFIVIPLYNIAAQDKTCTDIPSKPDLHRVEELNALHICQSTSRLLAPLLFTLALFTLQAIMREDRRVRRAYGGIFGLFGLVLMWSWVFRPETMPSSPGFFSWLWDLFFEFKNQKILWVVAVFTACNLLYRTIPLPRADRRLSGMADTRPPQLWIIWLTQGLGFTAAILLCVYSRYGKSLAHWALGQPPDRTSYLTEAAVNLFPRFALPFYFALALFSFLGMKASRQWNWRSYARIFAILFLTWFLDLLLIWEGRIFSTLLLVPWIPILVFAALNASYAFKTDIWFAEEVGEGPDGWIFSDLAIGALLLVQTLLTRRRPHFTRGVAAKGSLDVQPLEPPVDFFAGYGVRPSFGIVARFSTTGPDDAGLAPRGAALQFTNSRRERFDLLLSTGTYMGTENLVEFSIAHLAKSLGHVSETWLLKRWPKLREGAVAALRRAPSCYTHLEYYSQTVRFWISIEGVRHLVRYRLIPEEAPASRTPQEPSQFLPESPGPTSPSEEAASAEPASKTGEESPTEDMPRQGYEGSKGGDDLFNRARLAQEWRSPDYLKQVLKRRIESRSIRMKLEAQFHDPRESDSPHWFNPGVDWDERTHPWKPLGTVVLEHALPDVETEALCFNPATAPPSLGIPVAPHPFDPRSIADTEKRVHQRIQSARTWLASVLGTPKLDSNLQEHT